MDNYSRAVATGAGAGAVVGIIIAVAYYVFLAIANWKIFTKAGKPGWLSLIPFANFWTYCSIAVGSGGKMFMVLIPVYGEIYATIILPIKLARAYGRNGGFCVGMVFLNPIFTLILGLSDAKYIGPQ